MNRKIVTKGLIAAVASLVLLGTAKGEGGTGNVATAETGFIAEVGTTMLLTCSTPEDTTASPPVPIDTLLGTCTATLSRPEDVRNLAITLGGPNMDVVNGWWAAKNADGKQIWMSPDGRGKALAWNSVLLRWMGAYSNVAQDDVLPFDLRNKEIINDAGRYTYSVHAQAWEE